MPGMNRGRGMRMAGELVFISWSSKAFLRRGHLSRDLKEVRD